jgi:hypothetical protein
MKATDKFTYGAKDTLVIVEEPSSKEPSSKEPSSKEPSSKEPSSKEPSSKEEMLTEINKLVKLARRVLG